MEEMEKKFQKIVREEGDDEEDDFSDEDVQGYLLDSYSKEDILYSKLKPISVEDSAKEDGHADFLKTQRWFVCSEKVSEVWDLDYFRLSPLCEMRWSKISEPLMRTRIECWNDGNGEVWEQEGDYSFELDL